MPQVTLEVTSNILETFTPALWAQKIHDNLLTSGQFQIADLKTRVLKIDDYVIADNDDARSFVHLTCAILTGRSVDVRQNLGRKLYHVLCEVFSESKQKQICDISVEIREMEKETYFK